MTAAEAVPDDYVIGHVQEALGQDGRVGEWGLQVTVEGGTVVVAGTVGTPSRKRGVTEVATEAVAALGCELTVRDDTEVASMEPPQGEEELR